MVAKRCKFCAQMDTTNVELNEEILGRNLAEVVANISGFEVETLRVKNVLVCQMCAVTLISTDNMIQRVRAVMSKWRKKATPSSLNRSSVLASAKKTSLEEKLPHSDDAAVDMSTNSSAAVVAASKPKKTRAKKVNPDQKKNPKAMESNKSDLNETNMENSRKAAVEDVITPKKTPAKKVNLPDQEESPKSTETDEETEESDLDSDDMENLSNATNEAVATPKKTLADKIKIPNNIETSKPTQSDETESESDESDLDDDDLENNLIKKLNLQVKKKISEPKQHESESDSEESDLDEALEKSKAALVHTTVPKNAPAKKVELTNQKGILKPTQNDDTDSDESFLDDDFMQNLSKTAFEVVAPQKTILAKKIKLPAKKKELNSEAHQTSTVKAKPKKRQRSLNNSEADVPKKKNKVATPKTKATKTKAVTKPPQPKTELFTSKLLESINKKDQEIKFKKSTKKDQAQDADQSFLETLNNSLKMHNIPDEKDDDQIQTKKQKNRKRKNTNSQSDDQKLVPQQSVINPTMKNHQDLKHKSCPNCSRIFRSLEKYEKHLSKC